MEGKTPTVTEGDWYTNVALLAHCITQSATSSDDNGYVMPQIMFYQAGIGTGSMLELPADMLAAATGMSLGQKVDEGKWQRHEQDQDNVKLTLDNGSIRLSHRQLSSR